MEKPKAGMAMEMATANDWVVRLANVIADAVEHRELQSPHDTLSLHIAKSIYYAREHFWPEANQHSALMEALREARAEAERYQSIAAEQGTKILRLRLALMVAAEWGIDSNQHSPTIAKGMAGWLAADADESIPYFEHPYFDAWARANGLSNCNGKLGYKVITRIDSLLHPEPTGGK